MELTSTWLQEKNPPRYPKLTKDISGDVTVIGGGLTGVLTAYFLARSGKKVVLLEKETLGAGATGLTTAFPTHVIDTDLPDLIKMFGEKSAALIWQSGAIAIDTIDGLVYEEQIDCEFVRCPIYRYATAKKEIKVLTSEAKAAKRLGVNAKLKSRNDLAFKNEGYLMIPGQAKFHPLKFLMGIAQKAMKAGARIFEHTEVIGIRGKTYLRAITKHGPSVRGEEVIVATYAPFNNPEATHLKKGMYRSYVLEALIPQNVIPEATYCDLESPYHYFRIDKVTNFDRLILGGADHRVELPMNPKKNFLALEEYLETILGKIPFTITRKWTGPILEPSDGLPLIGTYEPHRYVATAFSGNGMTYAVIAALMFRDFILRKKNHWTKLYDPTRTLKPYRLWKKGMDYTKELFGGAVKNTLTQ